jgi:cytochrome c
MLKYLKLSAAAFLMATPAVADGKLGLGRTATPAEITAWDIDVLPDGRGLPAGSGDALVGEEVFSEKCGACHGDFAEGVDNWPVLAGGFDTLADKDPVKTVGSYWPYLSTVWDYVNRSMPFGDAQSLSTDEVYAIVAYILYSNDLVEEDFVLSDANFKGFEMHNKDGFITDDREATEYGMWRAEPCMSDCKDSVEITMRASVVDVTPEDTEAAMAEGAAHSEEAKAEAPKAEEPKVAEAAVVEEAPVAAVAALDEELVAAGAKVFKKCKACHKVGDKAKHASGPILNDIFGATAGAADGYKYSKAMIAKGGDGLVWDAESLREFLTKPKAFVPKTKMSFNGLKKDKDLDAIVEYLKSVSQ